MPARTKTRKFLGRTYEKTKFYDESGKKIGKKKRVKKKGKWKTKKDKGVTVDITNRRAPIQDTTKRGIDTSLIKKSDLKGSLQKGTDAGGFGAAFKKFRGMGDKTFTWRGKKYHTMTKEEMNPTTTTTTKKNKKNKKRNNIVYNRSGSYNPSSIGRDNVHGVGTMKFRRGGRVNNTLADQHD
jgi:hypothetical protein